MDIAPKQRSAMIMCERSQISHVFRAIAFESKRSGNFCGAMRA